jgi:hypothetical protein
MSEQIRKWLKRRRAKHLINRALELNWLIRVLKKHRDALQTAKIAYEAYPTNTEIRLNYYYFERRFNDELSAASYSGVTSIEGAEVELESVLDKLDSERPVIAKEVLKEISEQAQDDMAA